MKLIFLLMMSIGIIIPACGQGDPLRSWMPLESRIGMAVGIGSISYQDSNSSPLIYKASPKKVKFFYHLESNDFLFTVDLAFQAGKNGPKGLRDRVLFFQEEDYKGKTEDKKFPAGGSLLGGNLTLGAYYKISSTQESTCKVAVGAKVSEELFYPQGWTSAGIYNALALSPSAMVFHRFDQTHSVSAGVSMPILAKLTRLPYDNTVSKPEKNTLAGFFTNAKWAGPAKYLGPSIELGYQYHPSSRWGAGLQYEMATRRIPEPRLMKVWSQSFSASVFHQF